MEGSNYVGDQRLGYWVSTNKGNFFLLHDYPGLMAPRMSANTDSSLPPPFLSPSIGSISLTALKGFRVPNLKLKRLSVSASHWNSAMAAQFEAVTLF